MKNNNRIFIWVLLFLWGAVGMVQAKSPYYIVNGAMGVPPESVPEESEIARISYIEPEEQSIFMVRKPPKEP